ncbi:agmatine deiminase family protein [bacterium]|nr:agmatine deiminase family protein [bacterium]
MSQFKNFAAVLLGLLLIISITTADTNPDTTFYPISPGWNIEQGIELPIGKTQWEIENEHLFPITISTDDPPPQPSVNPAEWERMTGVLIRYPLGISYSIIAEMSEDAQIVTIVSSQSQAQQVESQYAANGVNTANCEWLIAPSNSMWTRDYGPWFIFTGDDVQGISNHTYNRPTRPYDNMIPVRFGEAYNIPVYDLPLIHTGGNYMSDGMGISISTDLVYDENPSLTQAQVDDYMHTWLGVEDYDVVDDILSGGIHHVDCWAKLLDPGRLIVKRLDPPNAILEANVEYWQNKISSYGRPYEVIRIDCASSTPYTNALILNNKVLVPLFNHSLDQRAMQTWTDAMPGYEILGYTGSWVSDDAIHCRVMGITDRYMLRIVHIPLFDQENNGEDYYVEADIHAYSDQPLTTGMPAIYYSVDSGPFDTTPMTAQGGDIYAGYIPAQPDYTVIDYYIHGEDEFGRSENHPFIGPGNPHRFIIAPDTTAPEITFTPLTSTYDETGPYVLEAEIFDNNGVASASVYYSIEGSFYTPSAMTNTAGNIWSGEIPGMPAGATVYYYVEAMDNSANSNVSQSAVFSFLVKEAFYVYDVENGAQNWQHISGGGQWQDQWHISVEDYHTSTHSWKCGDSGGGNYASNMDGYLISPPVELMNQTELFFWHRIEAEISGSYPDSCYDGGIMELMADSAAGWQQILPAGGYNSTTRTTSSGPFPGIQCYSGVIDWRQEVFDLSGYSGIVQIRFRFGSDGSVNQEGWYVDDIVFAGVEDTLQVPLEVTLTPENPPIVIPAQGGSFNYNLNIANTGLTQQTFDGWIEAVLPSGTVYGPIILRQNLTLPAGGSITRQLTQAVPGGAPAGEYTYRLAAGINPTIIYDFDEFTFEKSGADNSGFGLEKWILSGWDEHLKALSAIPAEYYLTQNYPNPFNASTEFRFGLPVDSDMKIKVYNIMGQEAAVLQDGFMPAGNHLITFNAGELSSGIYVLSMEADNFRQVRKMMLIK